MTTIITDAALYRLLAWLSPSYPVGGYSYSHGLEWAVEQGLVCDRAGLVEWIRGILARGSGRIDGVLFAAAWRATQAGDSAALDALVELASAWRGTAETALESRAQGAAFLVVTRSAWPNARLDALADRHKGLVTLPVAVGAASAVHAVPLPAALSAYLAAFAANLVSAGVRLIPLGQTDGQAAVAALEPAVGSAAAAGLVADLDALGTATPMVDWCSMRHETQYTRLFRS
ncbi:MAG: urease accessory protein UreF [Proteobacteria bacterium]|nr:urease accessory protein UreF [Pseudomonadota bacterium]